MAVETLRKIWRNEYVRLAIILILVVAIVLGFWQSFQLALNSEYPALAVATGCMCKLQGMGCDSWSHPFEPTLHTGDLIIVQGLSASDFQAAPEPYGDIIVFYKPKRYENMPDELLVHRAVESEYNSDTKMIYFQTKPDSYGPDHWTDYRGEEYTWRGKISEKLVVGKVVMRIPWFGHVSLFMRDSSGIFIIVILMVILVVVEFVIPVLTGEKAEASARAEAMQEEKEETTET